MDLRLKGPIFGLTLCGMLFITALLAIGFAFVGTKVQRALDQQHFADSIVRRGGMVTKKFYGLEATRSFIGMKNLHTLTLQGGPNVSFTDAALEPLKALDNLHSVSLTPGNLSPAALRTVLRESR